LSFEELLKQLKKPRGYPRCLIINEIGCIAIDKKDPNKKKAEKVLKGLFKDKKEESREIIFAWLSVIENPDRETLSAVEEFRKDPLNQEIIEEMQPQIAHFKMLNRQNPNEGKEK
jgi:hypothetical protein